MESIQSFPHPNTQEWQDALSYHKNKTIPLRFAVLVGEVVHHLRSCLDHIIWHFSDAKAREKPGGMEFPILQTKPIEKKELESYARKIKGVTDTRILELIEEMQPYNAGTNAANHALLIIHDMDRFDKHRELVIVDSGVNVTFPPNMAELRNKAELYTQGELPQAEHILIAHALQDYVATPSISFREFGKFRPYSVIKGLSELWLIVMKTTERFAEKV